MKIVTEAAALPWWLLCVAVVVIAAQVIALILAVLRSRENGRRAQRTGRMPAVAELLLVGVACSLPAAALAFAEPGRRALMAWGVGPPSPTMLLLQPDPWDRYFISFRLLMWFLPCAFVSIPTLALVIGTLCKAWPAGRPEGIPITLKAAVACLSLLVLVVVPFTLGMVVFGWRLESVFEMSANRVHGEKETFILAHLDHATSALVTGATAAAVGLAFAVLVIILFTQRWRQPDAVSPDHRGSWRRGLHGSVPMLLLAGLLFLMARPLRSENLAPWPSLAQVHTMRIWPPTPSGSIESDSQFGTLRFVRPGHVELEPLPYPLARGMTDIESNYPTLTMSVDSVQVNGSPTSESELPVRLRDAIAVDRLIHPERKHDHLILEVMPNVSGRALDSRLDVAYHVGFRFVQLTSGNIETIQRPILGMLSRVHIMGTSVGLARGTRTEPNHGKASSLLCSDFYRFSDLLIAAVRHQCAGEKVILDLGSE